MRLIDGKLARRLARRSRLQRDYHAYAARITPKFVDGWMVRDLCQRLQRFSERVRRREAPRLAISMPPRSGKSLMSVKNLIPWHLGWAPADEIIVASYGMRLAQDMTRAARSNVKEPITGLIFPDLHLEIGAAEKADWLTTWRGGARATGAGGAITGRGADILIVDDPFKDHREALSPRVRDDRWHWYGTTARSRVSPGGGILHIGTRWHKRDLISRTLEEYAHEGWEVVNYAAIAESDEYHPETGALLRAEGETLHPGRWTAEMLDDIRRGLPRMWWNALYMGRPTDPEGEVWQRCDWRCWTKTPIPESKSDMGWLQKPSMFDRIWLSADLTFGATDSQASFSVIQRWGLARDRLFLLGEWRKQATFPEQRTQLLKMHRENPGCGVIIENKASGKPMMQDVSNVIRNIILVNPAEDKVARARAVQPVVSEGRVLIPAHLQFGGPDPVEVEHGLGIDHDDWLDEVAEFPASRFNDRVDAATQIIQELLVKRSGRGGLFVGVLGGGHR